MTRPSVAQATSASARWDRFPDGVIQSRAGDLVFDNGYPIRETTAKLFDEIDFQRACQAYLWALPLVSMASLQFAYRTTFGAGDCDLIRHSDYRSKLGMLTANATTPYLGALPNMGRTGPLVFDLPAGEIAGLVDDFWQRPLVDLGPIGPDKGKGRKYVFVGPEAEVPADKEYIVVRSRTNNLMGGIRILSKDPAQARHLLEQFRIYPYSKRNDAPRTKIYDAAGKPWFGLPPRALSFWERLHGAMQEEAIEERDRFFMAMLKPLGIEKNKPFRPDERQKRILTEGALIGEAMAKANNFEKRFAAKVWEGQHWDNALCVDPNQRSKYYEELDERAAWFYEAFGTSAGMVTTTPDFGQVYLAAYQDKSGDWLRGSSYYRLHVPANPPVKQFWSFTVYDNDTRALIDNPQQRADLSSRQNLQINTDGSVDLYFGPIAPIGRETNWVETVSGRGWFAYFRLYAPTEAYFSRKWMLHDLERM